MRHLLLLLAMACAPAELPWRPCGAWDVDAAGADQDDDGFSWCADLSEPDCDDGDADVHPGAPERCDGIDSNCDGNLPAWELDADLDGALVCQGDCLPDDGLDGAFDHDGDGWTACEGDCDDTDPRRAPGMPERVNGLDDDCDGVLLTAEVDLASR